ncbi:MAG: hypothetical protein R3F55_07385 [Alphaproteobacteria bacterium]
MATAQTLIAIAGWYGWIGLGVAAAFILFGLSRIDPAAHGSYLFRVLLVPGIVLLWPLVLWRWAARAFGGVG